MKLKGGKWRGKRFQGIERQIDEVWRQLGAALAPMPNEELSSTFELLARASRPAVEAWREEATRLVEAAYLQAVAQPAQPVSSAETASVAPEELYEQLCNEGLTMLTRTAGGGMHFCSPESAPKDAERATLEHARRFLHRLQTSAQRVKKKKQEQQQRDLEDGKVIRADKVLSLAGESVNRTANTLLKALRANGHTVSINDADALHELRRFVRDTLNVTLRSERGKRSDLGQ